jgi:hypothetical protein
MATQFSGGTYVNMTFTGATRQNIQSNLKDQLVIAGWTNVAQAAGQGPGNVGTFTVTIASPGVVTFASHGFLGGERVILQTTGALPTGLAANTVYFIKYVDGNTFNLATTLGGANINTSGSQSGTHTINAESVLLQSATQPNVSNPIRVRLKDNRGSCLQVSIENTSGTIVGQNTTTYGGNLLPGAAKVYRIIATRYHFFCFTSATATREFVMAGMIYVPSFLSCTDVGYMFSNGSSDASASYVASLRDNNYLVNGTNVPQSCQVIWNATLQETIQNSNHTGSPKPLLPVSATAAGTFNTSGYRWENDALLNADVLVCWAGYYASEAKIKGQFFDMVYIADTFAQDTVDTFSGHSWLNLGGASGGTFRASVWVAIN